MIPRCKTFCLSMKVASLPTVIVTIASVTPFSISQAAKFSQDMTIKLANNSRKVMVPRLKTLVHPHLHFSLASNFARFCHFRQTELLTLCRGYSNKVHTDHAMLALGLHFALWFMMCTSKVQGCGSSVKEIHQRTYNSKWSARVTCFWITSFVILHPSSQPVLP